MRWMKQYANDYLADVNLNSLSFAQRGIQQIIFSLAQSQMDEPGFLIKDGAILTGEAVARLVRSTSETRASDRRHLSENICRVLASRVWKQDERGAYYCSFIVKEHENAALNERGGIARADKIGHHDGHRTGHRRGHLELEQEKESDASRVRGGPRYHPPTPLEDC